MDGACGKGEGRSGRREGWSFANEPRHRRRRRPEPFPLLWRVGRTSANSSSLEEPLAAIRETICRRAATREGNIRLALGTGDARLRAPRVLAGAMDKTMVSELIQKTNVRTETSCSFFRKRSLRFDSIVVEFVGPGEKRFPSSSSSNNTCSTTRRLFWDHPVTIAITTHRTPQGSLSGALHELDGCMLLDRLGRKKEKAQTNTP